MDFKLKSKEICKFIKDCAKLGIKEFEYEGLKFSLREGLPVREVSFGKGKNDFKKAAIISERAEEEREELDEDLRLSQLIVDDYEEFEKQSIKRITGDS